MLRYMLRHVALLVMFGKRTVFSLKEFTDRSNVAYVRFEFFRKWELKCYIWIEVGFFQVGGKKFGDIPKSKLGSRFTKTVQWHSFHRPIRAQI